MFIILALIVNVEGTAVRHTLINWYCQCQCSGFVCTYAENA